jgi:hypothetical protein
MPQLNRLIAPLLFIANTNPPPLLIIHQRQVYGTGESPLIKLDRSTHIDQGKVI